jgi:hypothetical protein
MPVILYVLSDRHVLNDRGVGAAGPFVDVAKIILSRLQPNTYDPGMSILGYRLMFIPGIIVGAYIAAYLGGCHVSSFMPSLWRERVGTSKRLRALIAFLGGFFLINGARLAIGCTISRVIWGGSRLDASAWVLLFSMFVAAVATSWMFYGIHKRRKRS